MELSARIVDITTLDTDAIVNAPAAAELALEHVAVGQGGLETF